MSENPYFEEVRAFCNSLPGVTEEYPWGHPTWKVHGKMFAIGDAEGPWISVKATYGNQEILVQDPAIIPAPYLAKGGWVQITFPDEETAAVALQLTAESYDLIVTKLPKRVQAEIAAARSTESG